jgi:hypothetical protein
VASRDETGDAHEAIVPTPHHEILMPAVAPSALSTQLLTVADAHDVGAALRELSGAVNLREADRAGIEEDAQRLCAELRSFASAMCDPADEPELYRSLAIVWLELRFEWQRHNLVANYDTSRTGATELAVLVRASAATYLLQRIELLLERPQLEQLVTTAMEIIDGLRRDVSHVCKRIAA